MLQASVWINIISCDTIREEQGKTRQQKGEHTVENDLKKKNIPALHNHSTALEELLEKLPGEAAGMKAAELFSFLSDSTRLRILWLLCHSEECVTDIAAAVFMSPPAVSHHLRLMKQAGLIKARREGKEMLYTLEKTKEASLVHKMVDDVFDMQCPECSI